jgi:hypothetical protein
MIKFAEIEGLHQIVKMLDKYPQYIPVAPIVYKGKIKLHGTNGSIAIYPDGRVIAQSREQELVDGADNAGFAKWVESKADEFRTLQDNVQVTVFGEWCGKGINKGCAIHQIPEKQFVVFMIQFGDNETGQCYTEPHILEDILEYIPNINVLPWYEPAEITLDFSNKSQLREQADKISALVLEVEKCDPWVKLQFAVEGIGEGIVYYPQIPTERESYTRYMFKAKGEKHQVVVQKQAVQIDPEVAKSIDEFVTMFVTENRCQQGLSVACGGQLDRKLTGQFLKWLCQDVLKESKTELEASNLTWDDVNKAVQKAAQKWWLINTATI